MKKESKLKELSEQEKQWNKDIGRSGLIVGLGGMALLLAGLYLTEVKQKGFYETNQQIVKSYQQAVEKWPDFGLNPQ